MTVDLERRTVESPGAAPLTFDLPDAHREMLMNGWDPIDLTLQLDDRIQAFSERDRKARPWVYSQRSD